jgi:hypothetical protein
VNQIGPRPDTFHSSLPAAGSISRSSPLTFAQRTYSRPSCCQTLGVAQGEITAGADQSF